MRLWHELEKDMNLRARKERMEANHKINVKYERRIKELREAHEKRCKNKETAKKWCSENNRIFISSNDTRVVFDAGGGPVWRSWGDLLYFMPVEESQTPVTEDWSEE